MGIGSSECIIDDMKAHLWGSWSTCQISSLPGQAAIAAATPRTLKRVAWTAWVCLGEFQVWFLPFLLLLDPLQSPEDERQVCRSPFLKE